MSTTRSLTGNAEAMKALAHPLRLTLLELLGAEGPLTATEAGERLDEAPGNMSWHLRVLARHGFVREAAGARGRRRPWEVTALGHEWDSAVANPAERDASDALLRTVIDRSIGQLQAWIGARRSAPRKWQRATDISDWTLYLTADETAELREQIHALFAPYTQRLTHKAQRPRGARRVRAFVALFPSLPLPPS